MEIRENLTLVAVEYNDTRKKAVLSFLDTDRKEIRRVNLNTQSYDEKKGYVDDPDKAERIENTCKEHFGVSFDQLSGCEGVQKDVYVYDTFNSLYPVQQVAKFSDDMQGEILQTKIKEIVVGEYAIRIRYEYDGNTYESKMTFGQYIESMKSWFVDPNKKDSVFAKFLDKFGVPVEEAESLIGRDIMVEVKLAMGKYLWGDIKKFPKK